jgi:hypothetical protein
MCRLKPVRTIIIMCTTRKMTSNVAVKKWIVRADCAPKNNFNSTGYAAVTAGDMVSPVKTITGTRKNSTIR